MPMDEVIRAIERADVEDLQDILQVLMKKIPGSLPAMAFFVSVRRYECSRCKSKEILKIIRNAEAQIE